MPVWLGALVAYSALEYYLGKTDRVKSNSTVELILQSAKTILSVLAVKGKK